MDGLMLGFLAKELGSRISGARVDRISQPYKDMLVLQLRNKGENIRLLIAAAPACTRIHETRQSFQNPSEAPMFLMLMRKHLQGGRILGVQQLFSDRLLRIDVLSRSELGDETIKYLYFEAMGKHSNLSLVSDGVIIDAIRRVTGDMSRVRQLLPGLTYDMPPVQEKIEPNNAEPSKLLERGFLGRLDVFIRNNIMGISPATAKEISYRLTGEISPNIEELKDTHKLAEEISLFFSNIDKLYEPCLLLNNDGEPVEALPFPYLTKGNVKRTQDISTALDSLYTAKDSKNRIDQAAASLRKALRSSVKRYDKRISACIDKLSSEEDIQKYRIYGELLTGHYSPVPRGASEVEVPNYYSENMELITIPLEPSMGLSENAQRYFKLYRKADTGAKLAKGQLEEAEHHKALAEQCLYELDNAENIEDILSVRENAENAGLIKKRRSKQAKHKRKDKPSRPMRYISSDGFVIMVGRNSKQNEEILRSSNGEDIWLHAKGIPASHVLIKTDGKEVPENTLIQAAKLACYYSKNRGSATEIDYCLRKYVKKIPSSALAHVSFTNNKTIFVSADAGEINDMAVEGEV